jgi:hypothetical protein
VDLYEELRRIVQGLNERQVRYAVVGGLAVSIYATPRATEDVDLLIASSDLDAAVGTLTAIGFRLAGQPMDVARGRLRIQRLIKTEGTDLVPVDLLLPMDRDLARLLDDVRVVDWRGESAAVVSVAGLRALKQLRGSTQDRADLEALGPDT